MLDLGNEGPTDLLTGGSGDTGGGLNLLGMDTPSQPTNQSSGGTTDLFSSLNVNTSN